MGCPCSRKYTPPAGASVAQTKAAANTQKKYLRGRRIKTPVVEDTKAPSLAESSNIEEASLAKQNE